MFYFKKKDSPASLKWNEGRNRNRRESEVEKKNQTFNPKDILHLTIFVKFWFIVNNIFMAQNDKTFVSIDFIVIQNEKHVLQFHKY